MSPYLRSCLPKPAARSRNQIGRAIRACSSGRDGLFWQAFEPKMMPIQASLHIPVLLEEVVQWLAPIPGGILVDGTLGGGGHTRALAERVGREGLIIALDRDPAAVSAAQERLGGLPVKVFQANFCDLPEILAQLKIDYVDGALLDLGVSSDQLADPMRGFSFDAPGTLDLRFDPLSGEPASRLVNRLSVSSLCRILSEYGEERYSRRIAEAIVRYRRSHPIKTAAELAAIVRQAVPSSNKRPRIDPATRTFQALRIAVNEELKSLEIALRRIPDCLHRHGRFAVISFHSLEDRLVKEAFRSDARLKPLVQKPLRPTEEEIACNPRSRSARLRIAERI